MLVIGDRLRPRVDPAGNGKLAARSSVRKRVGIGATLQAIDRTALAPVVRQALRSNTVDVAEWTYAALDEQ